MSTCCLICKRLNKSKQNTESHTAQDDNMSYFSVHRFLFHFIELKGDFPFSGVRAEECSPTVLAARDTFAVPAGGRLSLSCVVQHCGKHWTGHWVFENSTHDRSIVVKESARHRLTHVNLSGNKTQQILELLSINQSDEGFYGCSVKWSQSETEQGHLTYVNVTAGMQSHTCWPNVQCVLPCV